MTVGTSYFTSRLAAIRYYRDYEDSVQAAVDAVTRKVAEGQIHIGKPTLKTGETLSVIDSGARYAITAPAAEDEYVWIKIGIRATKNSNSSGWDLKCGEEKSRDVDGLQAERLMHAYCTEILDGLQTIVDQAEPMTEPDEPDYELEQDRNSGTKDHRWPA